MNRFENWFYWHMVPRRWRDRTEAQIALVERVYGRHETDHSDED